MGDMGDMWRDIKQQQQSFRHARREEAPDILAKNGIAFTSHNGGAHLIVEGPVCFYDLWPGTGKWKSRNSNKYSSGINNMIAAIKKEKGE